MANPWRPRRFYNRSWSAERVSEYWEAHARGCRKLALLLGIDNYHLQESLVRALQTSTLQWRRARSLVKFVDQSDARALRDLKSVDLRKYLTFVKYFCTEDALDDLDHGATDWTDA